MLFEIYNCFTKGFDTPDLKDAEVLLDELAAWPARHLSPVPKSKKPRLPPILGPVAGQTPAYAGLATCRESSNVCVMGAVGIPLQRRTAHGLRDRPYY
jgi:hypothetical protein